MATQHTQPAESLPQTYQLPLLWETPIVPLPAPSTMQTVQPQQVWSSLAPTEQRYLYQTFVRVLQEVLHDPTSH